MYKQPTTPKVTIGARIHQWLSRHRGYVYSTPMGHSPLLCSWQTIWKFPRFSERQNQSVVNAFQYVLFLLTHPTLRGFGARNDAKIRILFVIYGHRLNYFLFILKFICNLHLNLFQFMHKEKLPLLIKNQKKLDEGEFFSSWEKKFFLVRAIYLPHEENFIEQIIWRK